MLDGAIALARGERNVAHGDVVLQVDETLTVVATGNGPQRLDGKPFDRPLMRFANGTLVGMRALIRRLLVDPLRCRCSPMRECATRCGLAIIDRSLHLVSTGNAASGEDRQRGHV